jgi:hypothetical protein
VKRLTMSAGAAWDLLHRGPSTMKCRPQIVAEHRVGDECGSHPGKPQTNLSGEAIECPIHLTVSTPLLLYFRRKGCPLDRVLSIASGCDGEAIKLLIFLELATPFALPLTVFELSRSLRRTLRVPVGQHS